MWQSPFEKIREIFVLVMPSVFIVCTINRLQDQRSSRQPEFSGCPDVEAFLPILLLSSHEYWKINDKFERIKTCRRFKQYKQTVRKKSMATTSRWDGLGKIKLNLCMLINVNEKHHHDCTYNEIKTWIRYITHPPTPRP